MADMQSEQSEIRSLAAVLAGTIRSTNASLTSRERPLLSARPIRTRCWSRNAALYAGTL